MTPNKIQYPPSVSHWVLMIPTETQITLLNSNDYPCALLVHNEPLIAHNDHWLLTKIFICTQTTLYNSRLFPNCLKETQLNQFFQLP